MRRSVFLIGCLLSFVLIAAAPAGAQAAPEVPVGGSADVSNGTECAAETPAQFFLATDGSAPTPLASVVTDETGHVEVTLDIPADAPPGPAQVLVDCGIPGSVLVYDIVLTEDGGFGPGLVPIAIAIGVLAVVALIVLQMRKGGDEEEPSMPMPATDKDEKAQAREQRKAEKAQLREQKKAQKAQAKAERDAEKADRAAEEAHGDADDLATTVDGVATDVVHEADGAAASYEQDVAAPADPVYGHVDAAPADPVYGHVDAAPADPVYDHVDAAPAATASSDDGESAFPDAPVVAEAPVQYDGALAAEETGAESVEDDGADYWFWDVDTSRGPARRLACLTETTFHLDEVPMAAFPTVLERITDVGPQQALSRAFLSVGLDAITAVHRRGTEIRISYHGTNGPEAKTVDLGSEVDGVVELLSRRFVIHDVTPAPAG